MPELNTRLGTYRAYHLAAIVFISSFIAGYDSGVAGGILTYKSFEKNFGYTSGGESRVNSLTVGLGNLGSFVAAALFYPYTNFIGRKYAIMTAAAIFVIGIIIQTVDTHSLGAWYFARFVSGFGQGGMSVVIPMYSAEMTPKEIRGRCGSFYQWMYTWGVFLAYWIDYGVAANPSIVGTDAEWQIPVGLQLVSGSLLFLGSFSLPESVRWLVSKGRVDEAWKSLTWIRGDSGERTVEEFTETQLGLKAEKSATDNFSLRELWLPENRLRFLVGPMMFVFQNTTGSSALAVFGPQYFKLLVGSSGNRDLLLTGLFGAVKVIACTFFIWVLAERFGRRSQLSGGAALMASCMLITAMVAKFVPTQTASGGVSSGGRATVAMIYLDIMIYNCSWGPLPWAYVPEIFPTRIRSLGLGVSMLAHWATTFCFSFATPYMIKSIGAYTFLIFMGFDVAAAIFCFVFVRETRGKDLEKANGTQWEVIEKSLDDASDIGKGDSEAHVAPTHAGEQSAVIDEVHHKTLEIKAAHDTFGSNLKRKS
ncbi:MFS quinate transporter [Teratosphaeria nubilosa]|uniref:MFS quinate transporter n=1 Tax=Teratosphaeria nubilosa TaxID=161662 RepID=A0A6G1LFB0_9PEZI|nr:MFS quinate transporter [Teratosphaeria nubilosa]